MSEDYSAFVDNKALEHFKDESQQHACKELKLLKDNDSIEQLEEEDKSDKLVDQGEEEEEERDLTNLTWLTELRNQTMGFVNMALDEETKKDNDLKIAITEQVSIQEPQICHVSASGTPSKSTGNVLVQQNPSIIWQPPHYRSDEARSAKMLSQPKRPSPAERYDMFLNKIRRDLEIYKESAINYQSDIVEKPPFNYSHIIGMAMLENGKCITLQQICSWIERKFAYFRVRKKWNNSIRHNLSLHPCFRKIGRNKEDKGKGGYWELGVDPKKCDRKRIRNRRSTAQPAKMQKKHLPAHFIKTTKRRQQSLSNIKKLNFKNGSGYIRNFTSEHEYEELMLDEMDVQQNIDVTSTNPNINPIENCCKHSDQQVELHPTHHNMKHNNESKESEDVLKTFSTENDDGNRVQQTDDFTEFDTSCSLADVEICHEITPPLEQPCLHQKYKLGTIIISSTNVGAGTANIQNTIQRTVNSYLTTNSTKQSLTEQELFPNSIHFSEVENVPQNDNVIISSYISNFSDDFSAYTHESKTNFTSSRAANSVTLDFSAFPGQSIQQKPNVIVEQLIQQPSLNYSAIEISSDRITSSPTSLNSSSTTMCAIEPENVEYTNGLINEHFRPYIDGIDEAFQYLRSMDNTRNEDILDNLLDISVSDY